LNDIVVHEDIVQAIAQSQHVDFLVIALFAMFIMWRVVIHYMSDDDE